MLFQFNSYSSLLLIFFVHGLVYSFLLYKKGLQNDTASDKWLSLFLLLCIIYITPWMVGFAGWYDTQPYRDILFYTPTQHILFIGPVIFFYVQSLLNPAFRFGKKEWLHLLPGLLYIVLSAVIFVVDKIILKKYYFLANGMDPDFVLPYQILGFISMLLYFFLSLRYYIRYRKFIVQVISYADIVLFKWIRNFLLAFLIMLSVQFIFFLAGQLVDLAYWDSWWYYLCFAILFYYIAITGYANTIETKVFFKQDLLGYKPTFLLSGPGNLITTEDAEIIEVIAGDTPESTNDVQLNEWKHKLLSFIKEQKMYEDPELSLSQVAKALQSNVSVISKMINQGFGQNFNDFINQFRIEAVKEKLQKGEHLQQTLLGIAFDCGFNSKATFNRSFKKITGQSPKEWIEKSNHR